ncbi:MAG TPA: TolC family protein, partial [Desulfobaccales bacterium]
MRQRFWQGGALALILAALMWGWGPAWAAAQEAGGTLSLKQAINLALKEHPAVKQFRENMAASRESIGVAKSAYFPQANFVGSYYY